LLGRLDCGTSDHSSPATAAAEYVPGRLTVYPAAASQPTIPGATKITRGFATNCPVLAATVAASLPTTAIRSFPFVSASPRIGGRTVSASAVDSSGATRMLTSSLTTSSNAEL